MKNLLLLSLGFILPGILFSQSISVSIVSDAPGNTITAGTPVTFTATPSGTSSPLYQWKKNGVAIPGENASTYTTSGLVNNDMVSVDITLDFSNIVTSNLVLHLDAGLASSYPGSGSTWNDISGNGNNASLPGTLASSYSSTIGAGSFKFQHNSSTPIQSSAMTNWNLSTTNALSVETWIMHYSTSDHQFWFSTPDLYYRFGIGPGYNLFWDMAHYVDRSASNTVSASVWHHVIYTAGLESGFITTRIYIDGVLAKSLNEGVTALSPFTNYLIGSGQNINQHQMDGYMGLFRVYNKALSPTEVSQNYDAQQYRFTSGYTGAIGSNTITMSVLASFAGTLSSTSAVCSGVKSTTITLSGFTGTIIKWQYSSDNWASITNIETSSPEIIATQLPSSTKYRAVVESGGVQSYSNSITVTP